MSPLPSHIEPQKPARKRVDGGRVLIPIGCVPLWAKGQHPASLRMVPLVWKRSLDPLPDEHRLDCWYLWNTGLADDEWQVNANGLLRGTNNSSQSARLNLLIYDAAIESQTGSHRLHSHVLTSIGAQTTPCAWIVPETNGSISVWSDIAFQLYFGRRDGED